MFEKIIRPEGEPNALPEEIKPPLTPDQEVTNLLAGYDDVIKAYRVLLTELDKLIAKESNNKKISTELAEMKDNLLAKIKQTEETLQVRTEQLSKLEESLKNSNSPDSKT